MKKKTIIIIMSALLVLASLLSACAEQFGNNPTGSGSVQGTQSTDESKIKELEAQILALMQSQQLSETERKKEIAALSAELELLKESSASDLPSQSTDRPTEATPLDSFKYTLDSGKAIITKIDAVGDTVTIPSSIDNYPVYSIGSDALSSSAVKSVIISEGIEKLDWFAFRNCLSLSKVTIPDSVISIGYGSFDNTAKALTIVCSRDSFAHKYAQSYGFTYDIT